MYNYCWAAFDHLFIECARCENVTAVLVIKETFNSSDVNRKGNQQRNAAKINEHAET